MTEFETKLAELGTISPVRLRAMWRDTYRTAAPDISPDLLRRSIATRWQARVHGSLPPATRRAIGRLQRRVERKAKARHMHAIALKTGTRLVRSRNGKSFHMLVSGFSVR